MKVNEIENIHTNLINGNRQDCVKQIKEYGLYDFWNDYAIYLVENYNDDCDRYKHFRDMTLSYFRITNR